jgi:hypothetical protein
MVHSGKSNDLDTVSSMARSVDPRWLEALIQALMNDRYSADEFSEILSKLTPSDRRRLFHELDRVQNTRQI